MKQIKVCSVKLMIVVFVLSFNANGDCANTNRLKQITLIKTSPKEVYLYEGFLWDNYFLTSKYKAPKGARYIYIPAQTTNNVEMIRIRYSVKGRDITITHTKKLFCLILERKRRKVKSEIFQEQKVKKFLSEIFKYGDQLELKIDQSGRDHAWGQVVASKELLEKAPWFKSFQWYWDHSEITFICTQISPLSDQLPTGASFIIRGNLFETSAPTNHHK